MYSSGLSRQGTMISAFAIPSLGTMKYDSEVFATVPVFVRYVANHPGNSGVGAMEERGGGRERLHSEVTGD